MLPQQSLEAFNISLFSKVSCSHVTGNGPTGIPSSDARHDHAMGLGRAECSRKLILLIDLDTYNSIPDMQEVAIDSLSVGMLGSPRGETVTGGLCTPSSIQASCYEDK